jgi:hypothetical protein
MHNACEIIPNEFIICVFCYLSFHSSCTALFIVYTPVMKSVFVDLATLKLSYQSLCFTSHVLNSWLFPRGVIFLYRMTKCWIHYREHAKWHRTCCISVIFQRVNVPKETVYWYFTPEWRKTAFVKSDLSLQITNWKYYINKYLKFTYAMLRYTYYIYTDTYFTYVNLIWT